MGAGLRRRLLRQEGGTPPEAPPARVVAESWPPAPGAAAASARASPRPADGAALVGYMQRRALEQFAGLVEAAAGGPQGRQALKQAIAAVLVEQNLVLAGYTRDALAELLVAEIAGYGPIDPLLRDDTVSEVMVVGPDRVYVEREGRLEAVGARFRDEDHLLGVINRMVAPVGRRIDRAQPFADARLPDGSRVHAIIPPLALDGPALTVRKFTAQAFSGRDLVRLGTLSGEMLEFLAACVRGRLNLLVSGGAGSGKTTLLNALSQYIAGEAERIITIEDSAELRLAHPHVVRLESRPPNLEGKGEVTIRMLVRNALRMRPDRIIIGEVRGEEAFDLLQALNTGHAGSLGTLHANSPRDALVRFENMVLMAGEALPHAVVRAQIASAVQVVVHLARQPDGSRRAVEVATVAPDLGPDGRPALATAFRYFPGRLAFVREPGFTLDPLHRAQVAAAGAALPAWLEGVEPA